MLQANYKRVMIISKYLHLNIMTNINFSYIYIYIYIYIISRKKQYSVTLG